MCTNYEPFLDPSFREHFGVELPEGDYKADAYLRHLGPIIRKSESAPNGREAIAAKFGLVPWWFKPNPETPEKIDPDWATYNARIETIDKLKSFKSAWERRQFCLIPLHAFYEPCWETGKAVRTRISLKSGEPFALAGLWEKWRDNTRVVESFTMITVNADTHEVMKRMHRPGDEKRMPVILLPEEYDVWLNATTEQAFQMCHQFPAELMKADDAPAAPRKKKPKPE